MGYDVTRECIPVVPAQHYFMGGIHVDHNAKTSMERLYAIGETACNGVHGKNRLASNSLLESLVFAKRAALDLAGDYRDAQGKGDSLPSDITDETDVEALASSYRELILSALKQENNNISR